LGDGGLQGLDLGIEPTPQAAQGSRDAGVKAPVRLVSRARSSTSWLRRATSSRSAADSGAGAKVRAGWRRRP
jgi:hypothetical protein